MIRAALAAGLLLAALAPSSAKAAASDDQEVIIGTMIGLSAVGVLTTGIAGIVYAARGDAFDAPWVVVSLFSSAFAVATIFKIAAAGIPGGAVFSVLYALAAAWPLGWSIRSAFTPGGFGAPLGAPAPPPERLDARAPLVLFRF